MSLKRENIRTGGAKPAGRRRSGLSKPPALLLTLLLAVGILAADGMAKTAAAQGLSVSPNRVVFEDGERSAGLHLHNRSADQTVTYRLSLQRVRMDENGRMERVEGEPRDGEQFADDLIHFSPRQVTLEAGDTQRVRLMTRPDGDLEEGEYRAHLKFEALPPPGGFPEPEGADEDKLQVSMQVRQNLWIPVIYRHGEPSVDVDLEAQVDDETEGTPSKLDLVIHRDGDRSVYGDLEATFVADDTGEETRVARLRGVGVYTPNERRFMELDMEMPEGKSLEDGRLEVVYQEVDESGPRGEPVRRVVVE